MATQSKSPSAQVSKAVKQIQKIVKELNAELEEEKQLRVTAESRIEELMNDVQLKTSKVERLERTIKELKEKAVETTDLRAKNQALQSELDAINTQLEKMSKTYKELVAEQEATIPVQELLALYIALLEDVFWAQPHARVLFLLHGKKQELDRETIVKTTGHEATAIRKALGDLARANLVDYDVESGVARLKKRIYAA